MRFDPTDAAGGRIEIEYLKFESSKGRKPAAITARSNAKPLKRGFKYGEDPWPAVRRVWAEDRGQPTISIRGPYFTCKMIAAANDREQGGEFTLKKKIVVRSNPAMAWIQCFSDGAGTFSLNGRVVARTSSYIPKRSYMARSSRECVVDAVKAGTNEFSVSYVSEKGRGGAALAELLVRYKDGTFERFNTDCGFADAEGRPAICHAPPPASPWACVLAYRDYSHEQRGLGGGPESPEVVAGDETVLRYAFKGTAPEGEFEVTVSLRAGTVRALTEIIPLDARTHVVPRKDGTWELTAPFRVPLYSSGGEYDLTLESSAFPVTGGVTCDAKLKIRRAAAIPKFDHPPVAQVKKVDGIPEFHLDGKPRMLFWGGVQQGKRVDRMPYHSGMPLNAITVVNDSREWHPATGVWVGEILDRQAELYRRSQPDAYFVWDLTVYPPRDWKAANPDDICTDERGVAGHDSDRVNFSFASKRAIDEMKGSVSWAIRHLENSPYANRIIGYRINSGHTIEWLGWRPEPGHIFDFSKISKERFREFAAKHYPALVDASVPGPEERKALDGEDIIWNPAKHLASIAFVDFTSRCSAEAVLAVCGHAKRELAALGRDKIVGTYYGYTATLNLNGVSQMRAHYALDTLLRGPHVLDYIMSPQNYGQRNLGDTCGEMKPFATMQAHGIMPVIEDDTRTHNCSWGEMHGFYQAPNVRASREIMRRNLSIALCRREPIYCYALCYGRDFDFREMAEDGRILRAVGEHCVAKRVKRAAEVAVVVSEKTIVASPMSTRNTPMEDVIQDYDKTGEPIVREVRGSLLEQDLYNDNYSRYARAGVQFDLVLAEDLARNPGDYKVYVFENAFFDDPKIREAVEKLRKRDCTLVWLYAAGFQRMDGTSLDGMKEMTGFTFGRFAEPAVPQVAFPDGRTMGISGTKVAPLFFVKDADCVLAKYADGSAGVAVKRTGRATGIYSGAWRLDVPFARDVFAKAKVHIWCDSGDPVEANGNLFTLHARVPGIKTVHLPRKADVLNIFERRIVARGTDRFEFSAPLHTTHLFYFGDDAETLLARLPE